MTQWAISGGAGFLGLHLARRLLADGARRCGRSTSCRSTTPSSSARSRSCAATSATPTASRELVEDADVVVHAAAALPIQASRESIRSVNVAGTENVLRAARDAGVDRVVFISSTAVYGVPGEAPDRGGRPARRRRLVRRVEDRRRGAVPRRRRRDDDRPARRRSSGLSGSASSRSSSTGSARAGGSTSSARATTATSCSPSRTSSTRSSRQPTVPEAGGRDVQRRRDGVRHRSRPTSRR